MDNFKHTDINNKLLYFEKIFKKEASMEFLIELEKNGGGQISISQVLDFLENRGVEINGRKKVINSP
ncbi:hypothetical protein [Neobacillus sp. PS3-40]|uniref:hypothetical protein n=1 Tax=Neobacillus sp. PS3-40 TaxID=3070679 RepID=UPI0027E00D3F|nr:hypothetical protein [Neobacillus sp. PS3-40]WML42644.1 hypothetical protein RCG20_12315 [Neobacillus sp. PS3-40]